MFFFFLNKILTNGKFQKGRTFFSWAIKHMECLHFQKKKKKKELMENKILLCSSAAALQHNVSQAGYKSVF